MRENGLSAYQNLTHISYRPIAYPPQLGPMIFLRLHVLGWLGLSRGSGAVKDNKTRKFKNLNIVVCTEAVDTFLNILSSRKEGKKVLLKCR